MKQRLLLLFLALLLLVSSLPSSFLVSAEDVDTSSLPTYYELLEVSSSASAADVKKSYRRLALLNHPDKASSPADRAAKEAAFIQLSNAYEVLSSEQLRPRYDYLLTQRIHVYSDSARDWPHFNPDTGKFDRKTGETLVFGDGRFTFSASRSWEDARARWEGEKLEEEREKRALLMALAGSLGIALLPLAWYYVQRVRSHWADKRKKQEASEKLRTDQAALLEWQEEKRIQDELRRAEERERAAELRRQREEAAAAEDDQDQDQDQDQAGHGESKLNPDPSSSAEHPTALDELVDDEDGERTRKGAAGGGSVHRCDVCRKKFHSLQQLEQHELSNAHKRAIKEAESALRKGLKR